MSSDPDHIKLMEDVALHFLGKLNESQSNNDRTKLRFGTNGSVSVDLTKGVWHDFENNAGGGAIDLIMREMGLREARDAYEWAEGEGYWTNGKAKANGDASSKRSPLGPIVATCDYVDENGKILFQVARHYPPKDFRQRRPDGHGGWIGNVDGVRRVPYCLPQLIKAIREERIVFITEGEKDCNNLISRGLKATTNPGGASKSDKSKWQDALTQYFRRADVVIIADNCLPPESVAGSTPKATEGTPTNQSHLYNDVSLNPVQFLLAVVHDTATDLRHRVHAAELLMGLGQGHIGVDRGPEVTIRIGTGWVQ